MISISTAHRYKGLEKSAVILLDAIDGCYPLIHPDWVFSRVLGDSLDKITREERRLFYVALTRAIDKLIIITDNNNISPFLFELLGGKLIENINWDEYPASFFKSSRLIVKIGNQKHDEIMPTYKIRDQLKACGYQWQSKDWPGWIKTFKTDGFMIESIKKEMWAEVADGVEVRIYDESESLIGLYTIDKGNWEPLVENGFS